MIVCCSLFLFWCFDVAGTSNELDVQNELEENTHTHTW